jgi:putative MFS transporter
LTSPRTTTVSRSRYDTRLRGLGYSSGMSVQRIANALTPIVVGAMAANHGFTEIVSFIAMFLAATLVALLFMPETEGRALE